MSRTAGDALPAAIRRLLDGADLELAAGSTVQPERTLAWRAVVEQLRAWGRDQTGV